MALSGSWREQGAGGLEWGHVWMFGRLWSLFLQASILSRLLLPKVNLEE